MTKNTRYLLYFNNYTASSLVDKMPLFSNYCLDALAACVVTHTHTHTYIYIYICIFECTKCYALTCYTYSPKTKFLCPNT